MSREQMIDEAVRDYMEYRDEVASGMPGKWWAKRAHHRNNLNYDDGSEAAIRFAYWKIKCEQEFLAS